MIKFPCNCILQYPFWIWVSEFLVVIPSSNDLDPNLPAEKRGKPQSITSNIPLQASLKTSATTREKTFSICTWGLQNIHIHSSGQVNVYILHETLRKEKQGTVSVQAMTSHNGSSYAWPLRTSREHESSRTLYIYNSCILQYKISHPLEFFF